MNGNEPLEIDLRLLIKHTGNKQSQLATQNLSRRKLQENAVSITVVFRSFESRSEHFADLETPNSSFNYSIAIGRP